MADLPSLEELVQERKALFDTLETAVTLSDLVSFQHQLVAAVTRAEGHKKLAGKDKGRRALFSDHIQSCRAYGDSLAWLLLHPHTIRQLSKNKGRPPHLSGQSSAVASALSVVAAAATDYGFPAIACDITNCLRIGDVIVVDDPERPRIVELKAGLAPERFEGLGRRGRQLSRMKATAEYLQKGEAKFFGEEMARRTIEVSIKPEFICSARLLAVVEQVARSRSRSCSLARGSPLQHSPAESLSPLGGPALSHLREGVTTAQV